MFEELPLDLSVVAGVLTRAVQDTNSHVNLKSKERNTPNAVLRDAGPDNPRLAPFADQPVHLVVRGDDFSIEPTTDEIVAQKLAERMDRPLVKLVWQPEDKLRSYDELADTTASQTLTNATRYGSKATNLGFLSHAQVLGRVSDPGSPSAEAGYDLVPHGIAVPLQAYRDFVDHPPNVDLRAKLTDLIEAEQGGQLSPKQRVEKVAAVQAAFMAGAFPDGALERIRAKLDEVLPGVAEIKVRSSANAEDVPNFDGAGLHDSFAADTDKQDRPDRPCRIELEEDEGEVKRKVKPKSVGCAVRGVYASLWNKRAVEERSFARIDQNSVAMGLAIVPEYDIESEVAANAVVVTRVLNTDAVYGYSLSVQEGNNLVTNPDPGTFSEVTIAGFISDDEPVELHHDPVRQADPGRSGADHTGAAARADAGTGEPGQAGRDRVLPGQAGLLLELQLRHRGQRQGDLTRSGDQDPGERSPGLQADPGVRRPLTPSSTFHVVSGETRVWRADSTQVSPPGTGNADEGPGAPGSRQATWPSGRTRTAPSGPIP